MTNRIIFKNLRKSLWLISWPYKGQLPFSLMKSSNGGEKTCKLLACAREEKNINMFKASYGKICLK